jgi:hypothetical protein
MFTDMYFPYYILLFLALLLLCCKEFSMFVTEPIHLHLLFHNYGQNFLAFVWKFTVTCYVTEDAVQTVNWFY